MRQLSVKLLIQAGSPITYFKFLFLFCFLGLLVQDVFPHASVKGKVYAKGTNEPLLFATIQLEKTGETWFSDEMGNYWIDGLSSGTYTFTFSHFGFKPEQVTVSLKENEELIRDIFLEDSTYSLPELILIPRKEISSSIINQSDISYRPYNSSQELLRMVPGLFIAQHAGGGKAEQIFLRGFDIDHGTDIQLTVDGMPVNMVSHAHGQGYSDLHFLIPETVERIRYSKGPYDADKGDFTTAGAAGFETADSPESSIAKIEAGRFSTLRAVLLAKIIDKQTASGNHSWYFAGENLFTQGYFESPQHMKRLNLFSKYSGTFPKGLKLSFSASAFRSSWNASGQIPERAVSSGLITPYGSIDDTEGGTTARQNTNLIIKKSLTPTSSLTAQFYVSHYAFDLFSNFTFFLNDSINGDQIRQKENRMITGSNFAYSKAYSLGKVEAKHEAGAGIRTDLVHDNELSRAVKRTFLEHSVFGDITQANPYLYVSGNFFLGKLSAEAGIRYDHFFWHYLDKLQQTSHSSSSGIFSPKISVLFSPDHTKQFFIKAGTGFHSNDARAAVFSPDIPRAIGAEIGTNLKPLRNSFLTLSLWRLELENEFVYVGDEGIVELSGRSRRLGIDVSARHQINSIFYIDVDFNAAKPEFVEEAEGEQFVPLAPTLTSTGGINFKLKNGLSGGLSYRFLGDRAGNEDYSLKAEGYLLADAVLNYTRKNVSLGISVQNLFNREWKEAQFETTSRLLHESSEVTEMHYTPGSPFFIKTVLACSF